MHRFDTMPEVDLFWAISAQDHPGDSTKGSGPILWCAVWLRPESRDAVVHVLQPRATGKASEVKPIGGVADFRMGRDRPRRS